MRPITHEEVDRAIIHMCAHTAPGPDRLLAPLVKYGGQATTDVLHHLFEACRSQERIPDDWRRSNITLIPKSQEGLAGDPAKQRPIAVASVLYHAFTWIFARQVLFDGSSSILWTQRAFRRHASCTDVHETLDALIYHTMTEQQCLLLLKSDIKKAYDSMRHQMMLDQLAERGFPLSFSALLANILTGLTAQIQLAAGLSPPFPINRGIRQGCPLSPLLFIITVAWLVQAAFSHRDERFIHVMGHIIPCHYKYADDLNAVAFDDTTPLQ